jgi:putative ABC transport system permease protein
MNLLQLVLKQMRQRALSTWLTMLSIVLGVALAVAILIVYREADGLFMQKNYGYEVIVGPPKGSPLQLVLNTVYQLDVSPGLVPYSVYEDVARDRFNVRIAIPYAVGDSYKGHRIVGATARMFNADEQGRPMAYVRFLKDHGEHKKDDTIGMLETDAAPLLKEGVVRLEPENYFNYRVGEKYALAEGRWLANNRFQAVVGAEAAQRAGLKLGSKFKATHGVAEESPETAHEHDAQWEVVGILKPTRTAADRVIYIPLISFYAIAEHEEALEAQARQKAGLPPLPPKPKEEHHDHEQYGLNPDGTIDLKLPKEDWVVSAVLVKARGAFQASNLLYRYKVIDPNAIAVSPAEEMRKFFDTFFKGSTVVLLLISALVIVVAAVGILVAIYNSVAARMREIAILRALGATRRRILAIICVEAGLIGLVGAVAGAIVGHLLAGVGSGYLDRVLGQGIHWYRLDRYELLILLAVVVIAVLAGLVPAMKAYRVPVATNLVAA